MEIMEKKIAHLGIIQGVISRMANNSLTIKQLSIGIVSAIFALGATKESISKELFYVAFLPGAAFWWLDAYFLRQERLFRKLYEAVCNSTEEPNFSMNTLPYSGQVAGYLRTMFSVTLLVFYGVIISAIVAFLIIVSKATIGA